MSEEKSGEQYIDENFECDAPQWYDLENLQDENENCSSCDEYKWWWSEKSYIMPSPEMTNFTRPVVKPKKNDNRLSVVSMEEKKNMPHCNKSSLCSNNGLPSTSSDDTCMLRETSYNSNISTLTNQKRKQQHIYVEDSAVELNYNNKRENTEKKPCKRWQLSEHSSMFSLSVQDKSTDLQPKRSTSMKPSLPSRKSYVIASPLRKTIPKDLKTVRRSCPQKLEKTNGMMVGYSSNNKLTTEDSEDEDIKMIKDLIEEHNQKILGQKILYDDNGRRIRKTDSPQRIKKKENIKPTCTISVNKKSKEDSLENDMAIRELIEKHNRRILSKTSKYDLNGRRIRKGNTTAVAPSSVMKEKGKTDNKTHCTFMPKTTRRSGLHQTEKQEMHTMLTRTKSHRRSHIVDQEKQKIPIRKS